jgi:hypothetical protein
MVPPLPRSRGSLWTAAWPAAAACHRAAMVTTLRLHPDARPARRGPGEVQFGLFPDCGLVVAGLTERECELLLTLRDTVTERELLELAGRRGVAPARVREALGLLRDHDLLVAATPVPGTGKSPPLVAVHGRGALADRLRGGLGPIGLRLQTGDDVAPALLVVRVFRGAPPLSQLADLTDTPTLPLVTRATGVVIGPLVGGAGTPCLNCIELSRRDRDRARPHVLAQVASPGTSATPDGFDEGAIDSGLVAAAAGSALLLIRSVAAGRTPPPGRSWELTAPWPDVVSRRWTRHPACRCPN